jgi:DNA adenine methylase
VSAYLKKAKVKIMRADFAKCVKTAKKGDFVYFDPPYDYEIGINGFDAYQKGGFGRVGQIRLAKICHELDAKGIKFMLSNHDTKLVKKLFKNFKIEIVQARRMINSKADKRGLVNEVIVRNYI